MNHAPVMTENSQAAAPEYFATQGNKKNNKANYGRTVGEPQLSEKAEQYYSELKKKYGNMDFILVSRDMKAQTHAQAATYGNPSRMVVLIDEDKIERMAEDENYRKHYEGIIQNAALQMERSKAKLGTNAGSVKSGGVNASGSGPSSFFAAVDKAFAAQQKMIKKKAEKKAAEKKKAAKEAGKKRAEQRLEKRAEKKSAEQKRAAQKQEAAETEAKRLENREEIVTVTAVSAEELVDKINDVLFEGLSDSVFTEEEMMVGQHFDSRF